MARVRSQALTQIDTAKKKWCECRYCGHTASNRDIDSLLHPVGEKI
jgi:hypothetical protein